MKAISRVAQIKKWRIIDKDFSIETGELTPTMKLKRKFISKKYANTFESLMASYTVLAFEFRLVCKKV